VDPKARLTGAAARRVFSGVQPTGRLHIGNYIGALSEWARHQSEYDNIFCVVDLHALTIAEDIEPERLRRHTREVAALIIASGVDPMRSPIFVQSHVSAHADLAWLLSCVTPVNWLFGMTQYKSKFSEHESVGAGLLSYPVLMAADILLYDTDLVPVGDDQKQHVELTRDIAARFNNMFGKVFRLPEALIRDVGARVMGLDNPLEKMSKSTAIHRPLHALCLLDQPDAIRAAISRAVTDSGSEMRLDRASPGIINLVTIYEALTGEPRSAIEQRFSGRGYGQLKQAVADVVIETLRPVRERASALLADPSHLDELLADGASRVEPIAAAKLKLTRQMMGLTQRSDVLPSALPD
jgi:tryptophanyl-tRNA synthetase